MKAPDCNKDWATIEREGEPALTLEAEPDIQTSSYMSAYMYGEAVHRLGRVRRAISQFRKTIVLNRDFSPNAYG